MSCQYGCCQSNSTQDCGTYWQDGTPQEQACSGVGATTITGLTDTWNASSPPCANVYSQILNDSPGDILAYNANNLKRVQADINYLFDVYTNQLGLDFTEDVNSQQYNEFQYNIVNLCSSVSVPGGCDLALSNYCSAYTRDEVGEDTVKADLCGCYVSLIYPIDDVPPECDSMCHLTNTTQIAVPSTGAINRCSNTVCVIDNINEQLVDTSSSSAFTQICPGCEGEGADPCTCVIGGTDPTTTLVNAGVGPSYTQYCGDNAQCFQTLNGVTTQVPCPTADSFGFDAPTYTFPFFVLFIIIAIVILVVVVFAVYRNNKPYSEVKYDDNYLPPASAQRLPPVGHPDNVQSLPNTSPQTYNTTIGSQSIA